MQKYLVFVIISVIGIASCKVYSFSGATIPKNVKTVSIEPIENRAPNSWVTTERIFNQELRNKFIRDAGLKVVDKDGDYQLSGFISNYNIIVEAPTQGQITNKYRLNITVHIDFKDNVSNNNVHWSENFSNFEVYEDDISGREDLFITSISEKISNSIFNKMFSTW